MEAVADWHAGGARTFVFKYVGSTLEAVLLSIIYGSSQNRTLPDWNESAGSISAQGEDLVQNYSDTCICLRCQLGWLTNALARHGALSSEHFCDEGLNISMMN